VCVHLLQIQITTVHGHHKIEWIIMLRYITQKSKKSRNRVIQRQIYFFFTIKEKHFFSQSRKIKEGHVTYAANVKDVNDFAPNVVESDTVARVADEADSGHSGHMTNGTKGADDRFHPS